MGQRGLIDCTEKKKKKSVYLFFLATHWNEKFDFPSPVTIPNMPDLHNSSLSLVPSALCSSSFFCSLPFRCIMPPYRFEDGPALSWGLDH